MYHQGETYQFLLGFWQFIASFLGQGIRIWNSTGYPTSLLKKLQWFRFKLSVLSQISIETVQVCGLEMQLNAIAGSL